MPTAVAVHRQFAGAVSHRSCNAPTASFSSAIVSSSSSCTNHGSSTHLEQHLQTLRLPPTRNSSVQHPSRVFSLSSFFCCSPFNASTCLAFSDISSCCNSICTLYCLSFSLSLRALSSFLSFLAPFVLVAFVLLFLALRAFAEHSFPPLPST